MSQTDLTANTVERLYRAVSHYRSPADVLEDAGLSTDEKRVILSSWASDMYTVDSHPTLREVPGVLHRLRLDDILSARKQLDDETDPPPRGGKAMRLTRLRMLDCTASAATRGVINIQAAARHAGTVDAARAPNTHSRWRREPNARRYRRLPTSQLTAIARSFIAR